MRVQLGLPQPLVPVFWGLLFLEATFGAYLGIWPLWIEHLGAPVAIVGLVLGSSGFLRLGVLAPSARIAERLGYRRAILFCRIATGLGLLTAAVATHWLMLIPMLIGAAIGELAFPLLQSLTASQAGDQRMRSFAVVFSVGPSIALAISPLIAGAVVALWGMRAAFVFGAACTFLSLFFFSRIKEPHTAGQRSRDAGSSYRAATADPGVRLALVLLFATVFSLSLGASFIPTFLEDIRSMDPAEITTLGAAAAIGSATFGLALARMRRLQRMPFAAVAVAVTVTGIGFLLFRSAAALPLIVLAFFCRGGLFASWATLAATIGEFTPAVHRARAFAFGEMVGGIAFASGPIVAGVLYVWRPELPFEAAAALAAVLIPLLILAQRRAHRLTDLATARAALVAEETAPV